MVLRANGFSFSIMFSYRASEDKRQGFLLAYLTSSFFSGTLGKTSYSLLTLYDSIIKYTRNSVETVDGLSSFYFQLRAKKKCSAKNLDLDHNKSNVNTCTSSNASPLIKEPASPQAKEYPHSN